MARDLDYKGISNFLGFHVSYHGNENEITYDSTSTWGKDLKNITTTIPILDPTINR